MHYRPIKRKKGKHLQCTVLQLATKIHLDTFQPSQILALKCEGWRDMQMKALPRSWWFHCEMHDVRSYSRSDCVCALPFRPSHACHQVLKEIPIQLWTWLCSNQIQSKSQASGTTLIMPHWTGRIKEHRLMVNSVTNHSCVAFDEL